VKYLPYAFTQEGVAMLSSVLRSPKAIAIAVNIGIMRTFVRMRKLAFSNAVKRVIAYQLGTMMKEQGLSKMALGSDIEIVVD